MNTIQKTRILGEAGKWDICASSASPRQVSGNNHIGNTHAAGICHSFTENGRCISLFKTLMTNACSFDCKYCQNSSHCSKKTASFEPDELASVFMNLYLGNYVEGLFLSSGVQRDPDITTEKMLETVNILRNKHNYQGYIHFKVLPGTNYELIKQASETADRLSINLEAPNRSRMSDISDIKDYKIDILRRQSWLKRRKIPAGHTTQLVVGGSQETDLEILKMVDWEYKSVMLKRAYFSAFNPIEKTPLEKLQKTPYLREHRLYNVDFMIRKYDIKLNEFKDILIDDFLPKDDPKMHLARNYFNRPIDLNHATKEEIIRVPGIGPLSCKRILSLQRNGAEIKKREQLKSIGVVLKRAEPFIKIDGWSQKTLGDFNQNNLQPYEDVLPCTSAQEI